MRDLVKRRPQGVNSGQKRHTGAGKAVKTSRKGARRAWGSKTQQRSKTPHRGGKSEKRNTCGPDHHPPPPGVFRKWPKVVKGWSNAKKWSKRLRLDEFRCVGPGETAATGGQQRSKTPQRGGKNGQNMSEGGETRLGVRLKAVRFCAVLCALSAARLCARVGLARATASRSCRPLSRFSTAAPII